MIFSELQKDSIFNSMLTAIVFSTALAACSNEEEPIPSPSDNNNIEIITTIENQSRINMADDGKGEFTSNDQIALYINQNEEYELTLEGNKWMPGISWNTSWGNSANFLSYYPSKPMFYNSKYGNTIKVSTNQDDPAEYLKSDLLIAKTTAQQGETVKLNFTHAMSRLTVALSSNFMPKEELAQARIEFSALTQVVMDKATGEVDFSDRKLITNSYLSTKMKNLGNGRFTAVVCPQDILGDWQKTDWMRIYLKNGKVINYTAPKNLEDGSALTRMAAGKEITLNIALNRPTIVFKNNTVWMHGLKEMPDPSTWDYSHLESSIEIKGLTWDAKYGWYDCKKEDPSGVIYGNADNGDSNICWAAASANVIQWWLDQNKTYIDRYGKYNGPKKYYPKESWKSEIFQFFNQHSINHGLNPVDALNWFFIGRKSEQLTGEAAFFKEVLGDKSIVETRIVRNELTMIMKEALNNKYGIVSDIGVLEGDHAINILGAHFNEKGEVDKIYITDNNDRTIAEQEKKYLSSYGKWLIPAGIMEKNVQIRPEGTFMEGAIRNSYTIPVREIYLLKLGTEKWEEYLGK